MHVNWKHLAIGLAILPVAVLFATWIGFFNVGASTGHWKVTEWFLHFAMRSAVRTYALTVKVPDELPRYAIQPAAGHFARGCAICHGAPGEPRSPAVLAMLPQPPDLVGKVGEWTDAELFRIVQHGVRFTGMPAWPTQQRDDEVWAMVAFLRELPMMDEARWRDLAYGSSEPPTGQTRGLERALADCTRCHGTDGLGRSPATPVLASQRETYLLESLRAYAAGHRQSGVMGISVTAVDPALLADLARHFSALPAPATSMQPDRARIARADEIARRGIPERDVPACLGCHGRPDRNPIYPELSGQPAKYIATQLELFREEKRSGTRFAHLMRNAAKNLSDEDIAALAAYFAQMSRAAATGTP
ncbi:c-type cytochrome [Mesorhizobium sp. M7A.F.Ca.US.010.02.1.1]|uniref:c-type cytochrome n=1 Tax=Mesorhizobium sp. M7A.F.Ca.US.010.02.1.1 TaxID=2496743 RepID=UPI000FD368F2|nr:c-type cytochrome [Mesorhizobium sp. M7A.F.Ca.US.010.02.1.1]RUW94189.1 c-type cytochrome [Mesorhizobium sp. M7A.F.Ca.US.010.02.1.1]